MQQAGAWLSGRCLGSGGYQGRFRYVGTYAKVGNPRYIPKPTQTIQLEWYAANGEQGPDCQVQSRGKPRPGSLGHPGLSLRHLTFCPRLPYLPKRNLIFWVKVKVIPKLVIFGRKVPFRGPQSKWKNPCWFDSLHGICKWHEIQVSIFGRYGFVPINALR